MERWEPLMRHNKTLTIISLITVWETLVAVPQEGTTCGICYEDDRSAVYSFEAAQKAKADPEHFEFVILKVRGNLDDKAALKVVRWLMKRNGVTANTVKISTPQKSIGFLFEKRANLNHLIESMKQTFSPLNFHLRTYSFLS